MGPWDEMGVMKSDHPSHMALTIMPGSLEVVSHNALRRVLLLCGAEAQREEQLSTVAQQDKKKKKKTKSGPCSPQARLGWVVGPTGHIRAETYEVIDLSS